MGVELDDRRVSACPWRQIERISRERGRHPRMACCSHPEHGGLCAYDGRVALWRCKFAHAARGQG